MKRNYTLLLLVGQFLWGYSQVVGTVKNELGEPLPFVNIYFESSAAGTTTNENGQFNLELERTGTYTIIFKFLGYETRKERINARVLPYELNVVLQEQALNLDEITVKAEENPANRVIRNAIANREKYKSELSSFTADFYSKGLIRIKDAPERILGRDLGDFGGGLDSTRSGIIYLSETLSKISKNKNAFKERILASKVSGDDNGFSFNNASDVNFSFYKNTVTFGNELISPIADNAFSYYRYRLEGTFYDEENRLINKVRVIPRRKDDRVFSGEIFIVEDIWAIYAVNVSVTGEQTQIVPVDTIYLKQDFNYIPSQKTWLKTLQRIDFQYSILGFKGNGRFTAGYNNYNLNPSFTSKAFTNEVVAFEENANKKDSVFWNTIRPVPLTTEETSDYIRKDSLQIIRKSQKYLDSVDRKGNRFTLGSLFFGYTYSNTFKDKYYTFTSPVANISFNTVQGFRGALELNYRKRDEEKGTRFTINTKLDYGLSDKRLRPRGSISYRFNNFYRPFLRISGGNEVLQFNNNNPISPIGNTIVSLFFESNFAKFYERNFSELFYSQELINGIYLFATLGYEERKPLFNTTDYVFIDTEDTYTSNNPLDPSDFENAAITRHDILKLSVTSRIRFGQKYLSYPNRKFSYSEDRYPTLFLGYEKGFAGSESDNRFDQFKIRLVQDFPIADKGRFYYNLKAGTFLDADTISFVDYQHFNGNRTRITRGNYLNAFFLLPYYDLSTNQSYFEGHLEHNFQGYIMGKIPLLKKLKSHLILSGKTLSTSNNSLYSEWGVALGNLGWKKFRFFRVGFVQSHFEGVTESGINFGLQF
ncbi:MAG: DUF5686 and carboxypeptidase regulatory-like domain-containing protein [Bacteroidota bacterium]